MSSPRSSRRSSAARFSPSMKLSLQALYHRKSLLIDAVIREMQRVWGEQSFDGKQEEYDWLLANYGITEEEDVRWQLILEDYFGELVADELEEDDDVLPILRNPQAANDFLAQLLSKYRSASTVYER